MTRVYLSTVKINFVKHPVKWIKRKLKILRARFRK